MEPSKNLSKIEASEVPEDPSITLARKISSETWQNRRVKAKAAKEENMRMRLATGGPGGGDGHGGWGGRQGRGGRRQTGAPIVLTMLWLEPYKHPYYYATKQLANPTCTVP